MAPIELMGSRLDAFEKERMKTYPLIVVFELQYNEKIRHLEEIVRKSLSEIQSETQKLHAEIQQCKFINNEFTRNATMTFQSYVASQIKDLEVEVNNQLAYIESRVVTTNDHQSLTFTNCCSIEFTRMSCWEPSEHVMARKYSVNLASRSHGAFVVPHLTSKPVTSGSLLHTIFDAIFGLETYNFAITERTHIIPSEAFCFHGSEGNLTIRLWTNATVDAIEYEHDYWRNLVPISAPKRYDVIACIDHECKESVRLSECTYPSDYKEGPAQICHMTNLSITTDQVQLVFKTNHGQEYTCIYQLRVLSWK
ncbi:Sad1 / UNC-like protein [Dictyocaulus viviparus]|uniref:Sad1 / UNC-like protein n=1 Tax=Dictyocaulus viviparus TaxID=29172 RepID=A0A0D8YA55_DICVI|nr:Sad1 / UNC-like protein [Dictyocaulus viviparus]